MWEELSDLHLPASDSRSACMEQEQVPCLQQILATLGYDTTDHAGGRRRGVLC